MNKKYHTLTIRFDDTTKKQLEEKAEKDDRTLSSVIRLIIKKELSNNEKI